MAELNLEIAKTSDPNKKTALEIQVNYLEIAKTSDPNKKTALEIQLNYIKTGIQILQAREDMNKRMNDAINR
jgi:hypothetical protein